MMEKDMAARIQDVHDVYDSLTSELLADARTSTQLFLASSLHSADLLTAIGRQEKPAGGYKEAAYLYRLSESAKHDKLLLMDSKFSNIVSDEEGCMRHDIPVEYVRIIEPVIVTTETTRTESTHYYSEITRPRVYSKANKKLGAAVDKVFDPIFEEAFADVESDARNAASCKWDMGTHHTVAYITSAYSNGHFLSIGLATGFFDCSIGHNVLQTSTYIFDVASGTLLDLPDLLNTKENPKAKEDLLALMDELMDDTGKRYALDHSPAKLTAAELYSEMRKGYSANWRIEPDGIYVSIKMLDMNIAIPGFLIPFEKMEGILREEYLPVEVSGTAQYELRPFTEDMLDKDSGITVYDNTPRYNALALSGLATHLWIADGLGRADEGITGRCSYFYGFGVQNCLIPLPEPDLAKYGYGIAWIDAKGDHIEDKPIIKQ